MKTIAIRDDLQFRLALWDALVVVDTRATRDEAQASNSDDEIYAKRWREAAHAIQAVIDKIEEK